MAAGGEIESAYGYTELTAPGGVPLKVRIDETRRDPFEVVALRTNNLEKTIKHYEAQARTPRPHGAWRGARGGSRRRPVAGRA